MVKFETLCNEILSALLFNYQCYLNTNDSNLEVQHVYLTQSAIISRLWDQVRDQSGYRNKDFLSRAFRDLEEKGWVIIHSGKQNAKLYFPTEEGIKQGDSILNKKTAEIKCLIDGANVAYYPNREKPTIGNVIKILHAIQQKGFFGFRDVSMRVIMKPVIRHRIVESEIELLAQLEKQNILIQSYRGAGSVDDVQILRLAEDFQKLGHEVWIITNDQYKDHLPKFLWYKEFQNKIEFSIIDDVVQFNPPNAEEERKEQIKTEIKTIKTEIQLQTVEYINVAHVPDPASSVRLSPEDFLTFTRSNNVNKIFVNSKKQGTGGRWGGAVTSQQQLWFLLEGKNYILPLGILEYQEMPPFEQILDDIYLIKSVHITRKEDFFTWKQGKLDKKGWFNNDMFMEFRKILEKGARANVGNRKELADTFHQMFEKARVKYNNLAIEEFPRYEPYTFDELDFLVWIVAQDNGWESYASLIDFWFNLIDMDMLIENAPFYREFLTYLATKSPEKCSHLKDKQAFRKQYLTQFANQRFEQRGTGGIPYFHKKLQKAAGNHIVSLKKSSFEAHSEISDIPLTYYQTGVYALAKENGWSSYQELLDVISNYYSREFWEKKVIELEIHGDWYNFEEKYKNSPERKLNAIRKRAEGHINRKEVDKLKSRPPPLVRQLLNMSNQEIDREVVEKIFEFASRPKALFE